MACSKTRIFAGPTLDQVVVPIADRAAKKVRTAKPKLRFRDEAERIAHRMGMALRHFIRVFNENFHPGDWYITPTMDDEHEVHTIREAKHIRTLYRRKIKREYPDAVLCIGVGRGKSTARIHFHVVAHGVPLDFLIEKWTWGKVQAPRQLRVHNFYPDETGRKVDCGADYRGLATYIFSHWDQEEQLGQHYYSMTRNAKQPEADPPTLAKRKYSNARPPEAPKGYEYIGCDKTPWGYTCYHYIWKPDKDVEPWRPRRAKKE